MNKKEKCFRNYLKRCIVTYFENDQTKKVKEDRIKRIVRDANAYLNFLNTCGIVSNDFDVFSEKNIQSYIDSKWRSWTPKTREYNRSVFRQITKILTSVSGKKIDISNVNFHTARTLRQFKRVHTLDELEFNTLCLRCKNKNPALFSLVKLMELTGADAEEILLLTPEDVSVENTYIFFRDYKKKRGRILKFLASGDSIWEDVLKAQQGKWENFLCFKNEEEAAAALEKVLENSTLHVFDAYEIFCSLKKRYALRRFELEKDRMPREEIQKLLMLELGTRGIKQLELLLPS